MTKSVDAIYVVYLSGSHGQGLGMITLKNGLITGADASGVLFDGNYSRDGSDVIRVTLHVKAPPNIMLIQGVNSGPLGNETSMRFDLVSDFASKPFIKIDGPNGSANVRFLKLRDLHD